MFHDRSNITNFHRKLNKIRPIVPITVDPDHILKSIEYIISHFRNQHELLPRAIIRESPTSESQRGWEIIKYEFNEQDSVQEIMEKYTQSNFIDCRINAFPYNTRYTINSDVKNRTAATLIMIDLDLHQFGDHEAELNKHLQKILKKMDLKFKGQSHPTVLHTGNGYHVYQPLDGIIFEEIQQFYDFLPYLDGRDLTTEFLRFAIKYFSCGKADPNHRPSINNCMLRIPGTINSKNGKQIKIIQRWDGHLPSFRYVASDFFDYLIDLRNEVIEERKKIVKLKHGISSFSKSSTTKIDWIERLIEAPIEDYRKHCLWSILCPYLINVEGFTYYEAYQNLDQWLCKCDQLRKLDFSPSIYIKAGLKGVKTYWPPKTETLRKTNPQLHHLLKSRHIIK